jgi:hypothetical protein
LNLHDFFITEVLHDHLGHEFLVILIALALHFVDVPAQEFQLLLDLLIFPFLHTALTLPFFADTRIVSIIKGLVELSFAHLGQDIVTFKDRLFAFLPLPKGVLVDKVPDVGVCQPRRLY